MGSYTHLKKIREHVDMKIKEYNIDEKSTRCIQTECPRNLKNNTFYVKEETNEPLNESTKYKNRTRYRKGGTEINVINSKNCNRYKNKIINEQNKNRLVKIFDFNSTNGSSHISNNWNVYNTNSYNNRSIKHTCDQNTSKIHIDKTSHALSETKVDTLEDITIKQINPEENVQEENQNLNLITMKIQNEINKKKALFDKECQEYKQFIHSIDNMFLQNWDNDHILARSELQSYLSEYKNQQNDGKQFIKYVKIMIQEAKKILNNMKRGYYDHMEEAQNIHEELQKLIDHLIKVENDNYHIISEKGEYNYFLKKAGFQKKCKEIEYHEFCENKFLNN